MVPSSLFYFDGYPWHLLVKQCRNSCLWPFEGLRHELPMQYFFMLNLHENLRTCWHFILNFLDFFFFFSLLSTFHSFFNMSLFFLYLVVWWSYISNYLNNTDLSPFSLYHSYAKPPYLLKGCILTPLSSPAIFSFPIYISIYFSLLFFHSTHLELWSHLILV